VKARATGIPPLIVVDRKAQKPLHRQIYDAFRTAIVDGRLRRGQQIPSTRALSLEIAVSRFPILNAYAQLLAEGYFESRVGAGTVVSNWIPERVAPRETHGTRDAATRSGPRKVSQRSAPLPPLYHAHWLRNLGAFGVGQIAFDQFPLRVWSNLVARRCRTVEAMDLHYGDPMGSQAFRETIADYLRTARSLRCEADHVMIVSGSQQALEITAQVLLDAGDRVWVEEPGYRLAKTVLALAGCPVVPVPVDAEGLDVAAGIKLHRKARAAFVTPSHQFPLGVSMSASRRLQLLDWAQEAGSWIIEDDYDSEYRYDSSPIASLQGLDTNARVIYVGTFSKVLFPGLRLGYIAIPPDLVDRFIAVRRAIDIGPPNFYQDVVADFMSEGHFARHIRRMRVLYQERRSALVESLREELGSTVEVLGGETGMHLALMLAKGSNDLELSERAAREELWLWPLSPSYAGPISRPGFILGFGNTAVEEVPSAVRQLRKLIDA
jgi:GntR family transcriptional regulator / MocR family aminotransferase